MQLKSENFNMFQMFVLACLGIQKDPFLRTNLSLKMKITVKGFFFCQAQTFDKL